MKGRPHPFLRFFVIFYFLDMFEMVLKFGAQIVDALRQYRMPVIIYIPCQGELRGGAWVVLDSKINPGFISMVADKESRGGTFWLALFDNAIFGRPQLWTKLS